MEEGGTIMADYEGKGDLLTMKVKETSKGSKKVKDKSRIIKNSDQQ